MSRPEHTGPPELFYDETESSKYASNSHIVKIQSEMAERALELLALPEDKVGYLLDLGCGSGISGDVISAHGHIWVGVDVSLPMLKFAIGDSVFYRDRDGPNHEKWSEATVLKKIGSVLFEIVRESGTKVVAHANQMKLRYVREDIDSLSVLIESFDMDRNRFVNVSPPPSPIRAHDEFDNISSPTVPRIVPTKEVENDQKKNDIEPTDVVENDKDSLPTEDLRQINRQDDEDPTKDLVLRDLGSGMPFRAGTFDGAISISAIQWLCHANASDQNPRKRLHRFFQSLYACMGRGTRAVFQFYPENEQQSDLIMSQAMRAGFNGGLVVDFPNSTKAKKVYLVLMTGGVQQLPKALTDEQEMGQRSQVENTARRVFQTGKKGGKERIVKGSKAWIEAKRERATKQGREVGNASKFSGRKRKAKW
ncbi:hypothetical protein PRIPAC_92975 [Pristionchus pacificus]|uniref:Methyltransferase n=1 Tax=Pristionchus pacificus TaxID=54126 RepID=A0A2A6B9U3_PRIPA|nr:hypothetical protein PRIPAC_92975 [Pristionchus pacificus]|eukprot:PDM62649.1 methyltransferase [Pristionchus pacificus]